MRFCMNYQKKKILTFIKNQIDSLDCFKTTELKNFGFQIYNFKKVLDKVDYDSIPKEIEKINILNGNPEFGDAFIMLQRPIFNKKRNKVLLRVDYMYSGIEYLLSKKNNSWEKKKVGAWMNQFPFTLFLYPFTLFSLMMIRFVSQNRETSINLFDDK